MKSNMSQNSGSIPERPHRSLNGNHPIHTGIVVFADNRSNQNIRGAVLDLDDLLATGHLYVIPIHSEAFQIPRNKLHCELAERKNLERRLGKPLLFGHIIQYNVAELNQNHQIRRFERVSNFIQTRYHDGKCQILLEGLINPDDQKHFYTEYFHCVEIPDEHVGEAMPDVYVKAWINLIFFSNFTLDYQFDSFETVCDIERHVDVGTTPWNKSGKKYQSFPMPFDSEDEDDADGYRGYHHLIANPSKLAGRPDLELYRTEAYMTGDRSFWLVQHPTYHCIAPLKKKNSILSVGTLYIVDCIWNYHEELYMITNFKNSSKKDTLQIDAKSNKLRCSVYAHDIYKGVYYHKKQANQYMNYGVMDDPHGLLSFLHLTKYESNAIPITFTDPGPSRNGQFRFRVEEIIGDKYEKLMDALDKNDIDIPTSKGIVIDEKYIFSAQHGLKFLFDGGSVPPGTRVEFNAIYDCVKKNVRVKEWAPIPDAEPVPIERRCMNKSGVLQTIFQVTATLCTRRELDRTLHCKEFGVIDDNLRLVTITSHNTQGIEYPVWVSIPIDKVQKHIPRTAFHIVGSGKEVPDNIYQVSTLSEEKKKARREFNKTVKKCAEQLESNRRLGSTSIEDDILSMSSHRSSNKSISRHSNSTPSSVFYDSGSFLSSRSQSDAQSIASSSSVGFGRTNGFNEAQNGFNRARGTGFNSNFQNLSLTPSRNFERSQSNRSSTSSVFTDEGKDEDLIKEEMERRDPNSIPMYTGAVLYDERTKEGRIYDVVETLCRLKTHIPHGNCGVKCSTDCAYLGELATLIVKEPEFWSEAQEHFGGIAAELMKCISAVGEETSDDEESPA